MRDDDGCHDDCCGLPEGWRIVVDALDVKGQRWFDPRPQRERQGGIRWAVERAVSLVWA